jgi:hypothetical protein
MHGVAPQCAGQVPRPLLGGGAGGRSLGSIFLTGLIKVTSPFGEICRSFDSSSTGEPVLPVVSARLGNCPRGRPLPSAPKKLCGWHHSSEERGVG